MQQWPVFQMVFLLCCFQLALCVSLDRLQLFDRIPSLTRREPVSSPLWNANDREVPASLTYRLADLTAQERSNPGSVVPHADGQVLGSVSIVPVSDAPDHGMQAKGSAKGSAMASARHVGAPHIGAGGNQTVLREQRKEMENMTKMFWWLVPIGIVLTVIFECTHRKWAGVDLSVPIVGLEEDAEARRGQSVFRWMDGFGPLSSVFFCSREYKHIAVTFTFMLVAAQVFFLFVSWCRNEWQNVFWNSIEDKDMKMFWKCMVLFALIAVTSILGRTYASYLSGILQIRWRAALAKSLQERWLLSRAYYFEHFPRNDAYLNRTVDNPDQRLQEDCDGFVAACLTIASSFFHAFGSMLVFAPVLWRLSPDHVFGRWYCPGWLMYFSVLYALLGSCATHAIGRLLLPLEFIDQIVEADYRRAAMEVASHTESIALYGSEEVEHRRLLRKFDKIQLVKWEQMKYAKHLGFFKNFFDAVNVIVPFCILAPNFFQGQITLGQLMQITGALDRVQDACNMFIETYPDLARARATVDRLYNFWKALENGEENVSKITISKKEASDDAGFLVRVTNIRVEIPGGRLIWDAAELVIHPGQRIMLLGKDGSGKSVFIRAMARCWPAAGVIEVREETPSEGEFEKKRPKSIVLFVPQRPFIPPGSLHEAVSYPESCEDYDEHRVREALQSVQLTVLDNVPLQQEVDWQKRLSGGEQQRLAFAHAILRRPKVLILDETTSAVGEAEALQLYEALATHLGESTAIVTVGHEGTSRAVEHWHTTFYKCSPELKRWVDHKA